MSVCEDAPCCGCCGTNLYGTNQSTEDPMETYWCDECGSYHPGECDYFDQDDNEETE